MFEKTLVFLNLRFSQFYSETLFARIKKPGLRMVAILDQQFIENVEEHIHPFLDEIYVLKSPKKDGFLAEFKLDELCPIIAKEQQQTQDLRIICTDEFNLLNAGMLRKEFKLAGHHDDYLSIFRDKLLMKKILMAADIRVPKFGKYSSQNFQELAAYYGLPFVIKPVDSCGSYGVHIIGSENDFCEFQNKNPAIECQVEEYIQGTLYHVDSMIKNNKCEFICANEYSFPNVEYTQGKPLASIPLFKSDAKSDRLIDFARQCLQALKANNIINHMELFINQSDDIIFLEVSGRPPGALLNLTHQINFGINLMDEDFFMQAGLNEDLKIKANKEKAFAVIFPLKKGVIKNLNAPLVESRSDFTWFAKKGQTVLDEDCTHIVNKAANAVFYHVDTNMLRRDFDALKLHSVVEVETC